ncbi:MAG TPA: heavy-metal-associated domain-containing protein [Actinomyces sp.]|nr:heavy-metal-associated domain-containing protein [Acidobacteriota bacterium]HHT40848.1 heavy-metal-associated domain-containing protein [Actinomyces sp.]
MSQATFTTEAFTCPSCVKKIETAVGRIDGVSNVDVGFNSSRVNVNFDKEQVKAEDIGKIIADLGYPVLKTKVK